MYDWIEAANYTTGRARPLTFIVWHSVECPLQAGYARNVAVNWFAKATTQSSAHVIIDPVDVIEMVRPDDTAWHCGNGNQGGYGIELCGRASMTRAEWTTPEGLAELRAAADWAAKVMRPYGIPARWLTDAQLSAREPGMCTHADVTRVLGGTTHTDPGPGWPRDLALAYVTEALHGATPTEPASEEDDMAGTIARQPNENAPLYGTWAVHPGGVRSLITDEADVTALKAAGWKEATPVTSAFLASLPDAREATSLIGQLKVAGADPKAIASEVVAEIGDGRLHLTAG